MHSRTHARTQQEDEDMFRSMLASQLEEEAEYQLQHFPPGRKFALFILFFFFLHSVF